MAKVLCHGAALSSQQPPNTPPTTPKRRAGRFQLALLSLQAPHHWDWRLRAGRGELSGRGKAGRPGPRRGGRAHLREARAAGSWRTADDSGTGPRPEAPRREPRVSQGRKALADLIPGFQQRVAALCIWRCAQGTWWPDVTVGRQAGQGTG